MHMLTSFKALNFLQTWLFNPFQPRPSGRGPKLLLIGFSQAPFLHPRFYFIVRDDLKRYLLPPDTHRLTSIMKWGPAKALFI